MLSEHHLTLRLVRLKPTEQWIGEENTINFVFSKGRGGKCVSGSFSDRLAPGDLFVFNGTVGGALLGPHRGEMVFSCFSTCFEHLFPLFSINEVCLLQGVMEDFKHARLYAACTRLACECHRLLADVPPHFSLGHRSQLLRVAAAILSAEFDNARGRRVGNIRAEDHVTQVFETLSAADLIGLSVAELAAKFGCGRRQLNRLFHQHCGVSVATLRMETRLLKAASLLRNPNAKVINVAEESGFNHLGLFNTCFKRRFGASPGEWRNKAMPKESQPAAMNSAGPDCPLRLTRMCPWNWTPPIGNSQNP